MILYSTKNRNERASFVQAVLKGIPQSGGLFMPHSLPIMPPSFFIDAQSMSFPELSLVIANRLLKGEIDSSSLRDIVDNAFNFDLPLKQIYNNIHVLELFHGPTLAFKDIGARFMAGILSHIGVKNQENRVILVATSGDTGSAVANGFLNAPGIKVVLLYPSGKVSKIQEQQLTTLGANITALEISGTFDDCQKLVKEAFADSVLTNKLNLTSANSINIARLLPQSFYYHYAYSRLTKILDKNSKCNNIVFSVPSGNLGNLTGGLIAKEMGLPVKKFIAALNSNRVLAHYLETGLFTPAPSIQTVSNAMDVGYPSNFERIMEIVENKHSKAIEVLFSRSYSNQQTIEAIKRVNSHYQYLLDPHGAVGYLAIEEYMRNYPGNDTFILLETAHPTKFSSIIEQASVEPPKIPELLKQCLTKKRDYVQLSSNINEFKDFLNSIN